MVCFKGSGVGAAGDNGQNRRFHFEIAPVIQEFSDSFNDHSSLAEYLPYVFIHDEVHISLTISHVRIGQTVEFFREDLYGFREKHDFRRSDGDLPRLRPEYRTFNSHDIADIILLKGLIGLLAHLIPADIELHTAFPILKIAEGHLAHHSLGHQASGDLHGLFLHGLKVIPNLLGIILLFKFGDLEGILSRLLQGRQLFLHGSQLLPQLHDFFLLPLHLLHGGDGVLQLTEHLGVAPLVHEERQGHQ